MRSRNLRSLFRSQALPIRHIKREITSVRSLRLTNLLFIMLGNDAQNLVIWLSGLGIEELVRFVGREPGVESGELFFVGFGFWEGNLMRVV
jgi:hypothetical protein